VVSYAKPQAVLLAVRARGPRPPPPAPLPLLTRSPCSRRYRCSPARRAAAAAAAHPLAVQPPLPLLTRSPCSRLCRCSPARRAAAAAAAHPLAVLMCSPPPTAAAPHAQEAKEAEDNKKLAAQKDGDVDCKQQ
jgi:hypothetical protein